MPAVRSVAVTGLDWIIVGLVLLLALFGWAQGFVVGRAVARRLRRRRLARHADRPARAVRTEASRRTRRSSALIGRARSPGALLAPGFEGIGARLRAALARARASRALDGVLGAVLTAARRARRSRGSSARWRVQAARRDLRRDVQRSAILRELNTVLPPSRAAAQRARALDPFPRIDGPEADVAAAARGDRARPGGRRRARRSVVKILGTACGLGVEGSGWVAGAGLVVTNAHVVAGQDDTRVLPRRRASRALDARGGRASTRATTSPSCASPGLDAPALRARRASPAGHARRRSSASRSTGPYDVRAGALGDTRAGASPRTPTAAGRCARPIVVAARHGALRQLRRPDGRRRRARGRTTIFAATTARAARRLRGAQRDRPREALRGRRAGPVSTGPCARLSRRIGDRYPPAAMAKTLVIAEKPSVGRDLTRVLPGAFAKHEGYLESDDARRHVGGRPPRAARRARRVRPEVQEVAHGRPADRAGRVQARGARRALQEADGGHLASCSSATTSTRSSTPATPAARAS